jgi:hypothetical protein
MKVRLTVCGDGGRSEDVEVDGPTGSTWREVVAELQVGGHDLPISGSCLRIAVTGRGRWGTAADPTGRDRRPASCFRAGDDLATLPALSPTTSARACRGRGTPARPDAPAGCWWPDAGGEYALRGKAGGRARSGRDIRLRRGDVAMHMRDDRQAPACEQVGAHELARPRLRVPSCPRAACAHAPPDLPSGRSPLGAHYFQQDSAPTVGRRSCRPMRAWLLRPAADSGEVLGSAAHTRPGHIGRTPAERRPSARGSTGAGHQRSRGTASTAVAWSCTIRFDERHIF